MSRLTRASASGNPGGRGFSDVSGGSALNPDASGPSRRSPKVTAGNLELATPGLAATGSPPWAAPAALISMWGEVELEGRFSLWAGTGWWFRGDLVVLSRSHLRTGWQWGNRIPEVLFSVPVWIQGPQVVGCLHPRWRSVGRWWACVWRDVWGSEKHHRQLAGALRLSAWLLGTCSQVSRHRLQGHAVPDPGLCSVSIKTEDGPKEARGLTNSPSDPHVMTERPLWVLRQIQGRG